MASLGTVKQLCKLIDLNAFCIDFKVHKFFVVLVLIDRQNILVDLFLDMILGHCVEVLPQTIWQLFTCCYAVLVSFFFIIWFENILKIIIMLIYWS
jgi:hypothetical protein